MKSEELREEVAIELELIESVLREIASLRDDVNTREPTVRERTAAAAFLAQFYGGIENILKRISRFHDISIPTGDTWHIDLFKRFCAPGYQTLPIYYLTSRWHPLWRRFASFAMSCIMVMDFNWIGTA